MKAGGCTPQTNEIKPNAIIVNVCGACVDRAWPFVTRRKRQRPGIASNDHTMHVPTATSSANLTKRNQPPTRHTLAKDTMILQIATPQATSSQRTHVARTQGCGRMYPVNRRVTTQYLHTQSVTPRRRWGRNDKHKAPRELSAHRVNSITADQARAKFLGQQGGVVEEMSRCSAGRIGMHPCRFSCTCTVSESFPLADAPVS